MPKKTFKIGEYSKGGVITVEITKNEITVICKNWDNSAGYTKSSNQSNAKEYARNTVMANERNAESKLFMFLTDDTTAYYADTIIQWIKSQVSLEHEMYGSW